MSPPRLDAEHLDAAVRAGHPALLVADHEVAAAEARLERARAERTPDLDLRLAAGYRGESDEGIVEAGAGMTVPLWDAREGSILAARFEVSRARQGRSARENELLARLADAVGAYEAARAPLDAFRERIIPDAQRAFDLTAEAYRAGRASFLDMLDAQRTLAEARIALIELAGAAAAARARITQIVGPEGPDSFTIDERPRGAEVSP
jgi:cobalt-zinc-cadmium efflux system outer membrane protein